MSATRSRNPDQGLETFEPGDWVEVEVTLLAAGERSDAVPSDTANVPYLARVKGFLVEGDQVGQRAVIRTIIGRRIDGNLRCLNPPYGHDFGRPIPELLAVGSELRAELAGRSIGDN